MNGTVVVTGGSGFIGSHLVDALEEAGHSTRVFDLSSKSCNGHDVMAGDVRSTEDVRQALTGAELVFHLASVVGVRSYLRSAIDVVEVVVTGTGNVLAEAARVGARVVIASTSEVFGRNPATPWTEDADRLLGASSVPRWSYGSAKGTAEHLALGWHRERGLPVTIVRPFNAYGPRQRPDFVIAAAVHDLLNGRPVQVYDDGRQTRAFTEVGDLVRGMLLAGTEQVAIGETYNLGSTAEVSIGEAVATVAEVAGVPLSIETIDTAAELGSAYEDIGRRVPSVGKAYDQLGWAAGTSLSEGADRMVRWARANRSWLATPREPLPVNRNRR